MWAQVPKDFTCETLREIWVRENDKLRFSRNISKPNPLFISDKSKFYEIFKDLYDLLEELSEYKVAFEKLAQTLKENSTTLRKTLGLYHAKKCIEVDLDVEIENLGNCWNQLYN